MAGLKKVFCPPKAAIAALEAILTLSSSGSGKVLSTGKVSGTTVYRVGRLGLGTSIVWALMVKVRVKLTNHRGNINNIKENNFLVKSQNLKFMCRKEKIS